MDRLWPDEEGDAARKALGIALHRLRALMGDASCITLTNGQLAIDARRVWVDAWALLDGALRARDFLRAGKTDAFERQATEVMATYRGPFLDGVDDSWAISTRERARERFIDLLGSLARHWEEAGDADRAIACYSEGLRADDLIEPFYQGLMRCHAQLGRFASALDVYRRLRQAFSIKLGVAPSAESERFHRQLLSGARP
jgi:pentatricopeptide repeat protein